MGSHRQDHKICKYLFMRLLAPLLDSPEHMPGDLKMTEMLDCCETYEKTARLHRRTFMRAATVGGVLSTTMFGRRSTASFGAEIDNNVLVVLSLRGGIDGLGVVVPHGDPAYYAARPKRACPRLRCSRRTRCSA